MCTAAIYKTKDFYFGRNLDYEVSYGESVVVTPRKYKFVFTGGRVRGALRNDRHGSHKRRLSTVL